MSITSRLTLLLAVAIITPLALSSCAGINSEAGEPTATKSSYTLTQEAELSEYETCYKPTKTLQRDMVRSLRHAGVGMRAFYMVRNSAFTNSWTVAADLEGPGFEGEGPVALFDAIGITVKRIGIGNIQPFNNIAKEQTTLDWTIDEAAFEGLSIDYKIGLELLNQCIHQELVDNPNTPIYELDP